MTDLDEAIEALYALALSDEVLLRSARPLKALFTRPFEIDQDDLIAEVEFNAQEASSIRTALSPRPISNSCSYNEGALDVDRFEANLGCWMIRMA